MSGNAQKTPFAETINRFAEKKVNDAIALQGYALPASVVAVAGSIVTVKFEVNAAPFTLPQVEMPIAGPEWARAPTQIGDKGLVFPADVSIGNVTGLGDGVPDFSTPANLAALTFFPVGNKNWSASDDPNAWVLYGPNGAILRTSDSKAKVTANSSGVVVNYDGKTVTVNDTSITLNFSGKTFTLNSAGVTLNCDLVVNGKLTSTDTTSLGGGAQPVKLADGTSATKVKAT
jgi:hypothetical protein